MLITRKDPFTEEEITLDLDITDSEYRDWTGGNLIQRAMPRLNADEREFVLNGVKPGTWDSRFPPEEDSDGNDDYNDDIAF